ncbi:cobaltochelatase CobT-related protein [Lachnospira multipara]|uniref:cobaltochelatase CobT-related protein n=1 Tax=Lachnospira multipara TaxID=28051 RepID=UPI0004272399|nr:VWA domain-containing protein [Lachnospira multipara]
MNNEKLIQQQMLERVASSFITNKPIRLKWLEGNDLGYTSCSEPTTIHVAWEHCYYTGLNNDDKFRIRTGVAAHETLHQIFTNFDYTNKVTKKMTRGEAAIFMQFANTIEDPAIEYFADEVMSGWFLDGLKFSIQRIFDLSPEINNSQNAFTQLINALINFGDIGFVKGSFTFPEAKKYFKIIAPIYNKAIVERSSKKRINYAIKCMELTRPLWEEELKKQEFFEKLLKEMQENLSKKGEGTNSEPSGDKQQKKAESEVAKRRDSAIRKIKKADDNANADNNNAGNNGEEKDKNNSDNKGEEKDKNVSEESGKEPTNNNCNSNTTSETTSETSKTDSEPTFEPTSKTASEEIEGITLTPEMASKVKPICDTSETERAESLKAIESLSKIIEKELNSKDSKTKKTDPTNIDIKTDNNPSLKRYTCLNKKVSATNVAAYSSVVNELSPQIKSLTKKLEKIIEQDIDEARRATSGNYNVIRGTVGTTAKIFDKIKEKSNKKNIEVLLLVDHSGSMGGHKIEIARTTSIILAESLSRLNIDFSIIGFAADKLGYNAVHFHYCNRKENSLSQRSSLLSMEPGGNNFDGYSIRYATEYLKNSPSNKKKLLFIISDGKPHARAYSRAGLNGIEDTTLAIKDAKKSVSLFGIGIGNCDPEVLLKMYGKDFIHVKDIALLPNELSKRLSKAL